MSGRGYSQQQIAFDSVTFSAPAAEVAKQEGMTAAAVSRVELLQAAQEIAVQLAQQHGEVTADDVQAVLIQWGHHPSELGNAAGSIFKGKHWVFVRFCESTRVSNHKRVIRAWRLR